MAFARARRLRSTEANRFAWSVRRVRSDSARAAPRPAAAGRPRSCSAPARAFTEHVAATHHGCRRPRAMSTPIDASPTRGAEHRRSAVAERRHRERPSARHLPHGRPLAGRSPGARDVPSSQMRPARRLRDRRVRIASDPARTRVDPAVRRTTRPSSPSVDAAHDHASAEALRASRSAPMTTTRSSVVDERRRSRRSGCRGLSDHARRPSPNPGSGVPSGRIPRHDRLLDVDPVEGRRSSLSRRSSPARRSRPPVTAAV